MISNISIGLVNNSEFSFETRRGAFEKHSVCDVYMSIGKDTATKYRKKNRIIQTLLVIVDANQWQAEIDAQYSVIWIHRNNYR